MPTGAELARLFHSIPKLLSHGDGKAMSRLYNSRTHLYKHPTHKHENELPSSLNKRTPTQARSNTVYPLFMNARMRKKYQQSISDSQCEWEVVIEQMYIIAQVKKTSKGFVGIRERRLKHFCEIGDRADGAGGLMFMNHDTVSQYTICFDVQHTN
ncbi:unnamed protein product [Parnassius mnemosyne]|uniref:Uncharacterized protein n=1 Tax=Parnassius mnemosyne TaxID=213953 RepID=A0AAV1KI74_9NEOP